MNLLVDEVQRVSAGEARAETSVITFTPGSQGSSWGDSVRRQDDKAGISEGRLIGLGFEVSPRRSELPASCWAFPHAHVVSLRGTQRLEGYAPFPTRESVHPFSQSRWHLCCEPHLDEVLPCRGPDADSTRACCLLTGHPHPLLCLSVLVPLSLHVFLTSLCLSVSGVCWPRGSGRWACV